MGSVFSCNQQQNYNVSTDEHPANNNWTFLQLDKKLFNAGRDKFMVLYNIVVLIYQLSVGMTYVAGILLK